MDTGKAFLDLTRNLGSGHASYVLAELNDLLTAAPPDAFGVLGTPYIPDPYLANYVAAMVELASRSRSSQWRG